MSDIRFVFDDNYTGNYVETGIGDFVTVFEEFNLQKMLVDIKRVGLRDSYAKMELQPSGKESSGSNEMDIMLERAIRMKDVDFQLSMPGNFFNIDNLSMKIVPEEVNFQEKKIHLQRFLLRSTEIAFRKTQTTGTAKENVAADTSAMNALPWDIEIANLDLSDNVISYTDSTTLKTNPSAFADIKLSNFTADIEGIKAAGKIIGQPSMNSVSVRMRDFRKSAYCCHKCQR